MITSVKTEKLASSTANDPRWLSVVARDKAADSKVVLGMTPTNFRNGGANTAIQFAIGKC
jgi:hypothetical protein